MRQQISDVLARNERGVWAVSLAIGLIVFSEWMEATYEGNLDLTNRTTQWLLGVAFAASVLIAVGYKREWVANHLPDLRGGVTGWFATVLVLLGGWSLAFVGTAILSTADGPLPIQWANWIFVRTSAVSFLVGAAIKTSTVLRALKHKRDEEPDPADTDEGTDASDEDTAGSSPMAYVGRDSYP